MIYLQNVQLNYASKRWNPSLNDFSSNSTLKFMINAQNFQMKKSMILKRLSIKLPSLRKSLDQSWSSIEDLHFELQKCGFEASERNLRSSIADLNDVRKKTFSNVAMHFKQKSDLSLPKDEKSRFQPQRSCEVTPMHEQSRRKYDRRTT